MVDQSLRRMVMAVGIVFLLWNPGFAEAENGGTYQYEVELSDFKKSEMKRYGITPVHPYAFELKTLQNSMWTLAYQDRDISWSKKKHVFDRPAIKALGPQLVDHFRRAGKHQRVVFEIQKASGKTVFKGDVFLTPEGLNWRVTNFKGAGKKVGDFSVLGDAERLVPLKNQVYKTKEEHQGLIQNVTNWIIVSSILPEKNRVLPEAQISSQQSAEDIVREVKKRLNILETLRNEGVISDSEYRRRREEILKGL